MGHNPDRDPLRLYPFDISIRERLLADDQHLLTAQLAELSKPGVSLPCIRLLAARQTAQGALFCKQPAQGERSSASILA